MENVLNSSITQWTDQSENKNHIYIYIYVINDLNMQED